MQAPPALFIYDVFPGGGIAHKVYARAEQCFRRARAAIGACPCTAPDGCPGCVKSSVGFNLGLSKQAAVLILDGLLMAWAEDISSGGGHGPRARARARGRGGCCLGR